MNAGPELDALVAEHFTEIPCCRCWMSLNAAPNGDCEKCGARRLRFSQDTVHALYLVQALVRRGFECVLTISQTCGSTQVNTYPIACTSTTWPGKTLAHSVALAALDALGFQVNA